MSSRRQDPTPCRISKSTAQTIQNEEETCRTYVTLHSRSSPCGNALGDDSMPTFAEIVADALDGRRIDVRECHYCGGNL